MFVTRTRYEDAERVCDVFRSQVAQLERANVILLESLENTREEVREQRAHNRTLVQTIVEMRREGFEKAPATAVLPPRKADPVQDAIALAAKNDAALRRHLGAYARAARAEGTTDDEIVAKVLHWEEDAEGD